MLLASLLDKMLAFTSIPDRQHGISVLKKESPSATERVKAEEEGNDFLADVVYMGTEPPTKYV